MFWFLARVYINRGYLINIVFLFFWHCWHQFCLLINDHVLTPHPIIMFFFYYLLSYFPINLVSYCFESQCRFVFGILKECEQLLAEVCDRSSLCLDLLESVRCLFWQSGFLGGLNHTYEQAHSYNSVKHSWKAQLYVATSCSSFHVLSHLILLSF